MSLNIMALLSVGQHPKSARARRADQDAKAIELAMNMENATLNLVHAGDENNEALRLYLGMGVDKITVLKQSEQADIIPALVDYLRQHKSDIILTGIRAERGEASGLLPYIIAEQLGWPMVTRIVAIESVNQNEAEVLQALPRGQRRAIKVKLPFIASVDNAAPSARQSAFAAARRGTIEIVDSVEVADTDKQQWQISPGRKRARRLKVVKAKTAADRFKAATAKSQSSGGKILLSESTDEKSQAIMKVLIEEGILT